MTDRKFIRVSLSIVAVAMLVILLTGCASTVDTAVIDAGCYPSETTMIEAQALQKTNPIQSSTLGLKATTRQWVSDIERYNNLAAQHNQLIKHIKTHCQFSNQGKTK